jgi:hypothetical protein
VENSDINDDQELHRPLAITLLSGLYLFLFLITATSYGHPVPFLGTIYHDRVAQLIIFTDSLICLYLFLGIMKQQNLTWYLLLGYNTFEVVNTLTNLWRIPTTELSKILGKKVDASGLFASNMLVIIGILLLSGFIIRQRTDFTNHSRYLF